MKKIEFLQKMGKMFDKCQPTIEDEEKTLGRLLILNKRAEKEDFEALAEILVLTVLLDQQIKEKNEPKK